MLTMLIAASVFSGVALESGICPRGVPVRYAVVGGTPADRETIAASLDTWALGTAPGPSDEAAATRQAHRIAVNGLRFLPTEAPGAAWMFLVGGGGENLPSGGRAVIRLPEDPDSATVIHEIGRGLGLGDRPMSPDGLPTPGDLDFVRALYPPRLESYRIPPPRRRP